MFISFVLLAVLWCMVLILPIKYGKKKKKKKDSALFWILIYKHFGILSKLIKTHLTLYFMHRSLVHTGEKPLNLDSNLYVTNHTE